MGYGATFGILGGHGPLGPPPINPPMSTGPCVHGPSGAVFYALSAGRMFRSVSVFTQRTVKLCNLRFSWSSSKTEADRVLDIAVWSVPVFRQYRVKL